MGFGGLGIGETIFILVVVLLIFGPRRLPEIGSALGKGIREFRRSVNEVKHELSVQEPPARPSTGTTTAPIAGEEAAPFRTPPLNPPAAPLAGENTILPPPETVDVGETKEPLDS